jgi:glucokinase
MPAPTRHLGLDLGVTNLKWAVLEHDGGDWRLLADGRVPTEAAGGPDAIVAQLGRVGSDVMTAWPGIGSAGIGVPGARFDPLSGEVRVLVNVPGAWDDRVVTRRVGGELGIPVAVVNDARAFGLAELRLGAGRGASSMVGVTLGTGVGGVIVIGGQVVRGHDGTAGELGHQTIDPDGPWCGCGNRGCVEAYARADQVAAACGTATPEEAVRRARDGDARALEGLAQVGRYLGIGIANVVTLLTPDRVVVGGGVAAAGDLLLEPIRAELRRRVRMTSLADVRVATAELGPGAGAVGAAIHGAEAADGRV